MAIKLRERFPEIFIIIISGYDAPDIARPTIMNIFVKKPFSLSETIMPILKKRYPHKKT
ncbi:MAG: hypothetical protein PHT40_01715 [Patescibacteria group bacterium]|nr:hypothetical protein [Patescibacteria group bacterium]